MQPPTDTGNLTTGLEDIIDSAFLEVLFSPDCTDTYITELIKRLRDPTQKDLLLSAARDGIKAFANLRTESIPKTAFFIYLAFAEALGVCVDYLKGGHRQCFMGLHAEIKTL